MSDTRTSNEKVARLRAVFDDRSKEFRRSHSEALFNECERLQRQNDDLRRNNNAWVEANGPGGWIDELRKSSTAEPRTYADTSGTYASPAHEPAAPASKKLVDRLLEACVGGCTCLTKTPDVEHHDEMCTYRLHYEAWLALAGRTADEPPAEPIGYLHKIVEPDGPLNVMYSASSDNPWSHWVKKHADQCRYECTPLYARPSQPPSVPLTYETFWQRVRETGWNPSPDELRQLLASQKEREDGAGVPSTDLTKEPAPLADQDGPGEEDGPWADGWENRHSKGANDLTLDQGAFGGEPDEYAR